jgi:hypothetical protein
MHNILYSGDSIAVTFLGFEITQDILPNISISTSYQMGLVFGIDERMVHGCGGYCVGDFPQSWFISCYIDMCCVLGRGHGDGPLKKRVSRLLFLSILLWL